MNDHDEHLEIEVKIQVATHAPIRQKLNELGATLSAERVYERNVRFEDTTYSLTPSHRVLRLRQDTRTRLTYKEPQPEAYAGVQARTELEVTVSDFALMERILEKLGFFSAWIYEKYRTTYTLYSAEVTLDELPFGNFVEIEGDPAAIEKAVAALFPDGATRIPASYSDLFIQLKARLELHFGDLTFANFKGVTVPPNAFTKLLTKKG